MTPEQVAEYVAQLKLGAAMDEARRKEQENERARQRRAEAKRAAKWLKVAQEEQGYRG